MNLSSLWPARSPSASRPAFDDNEQRRQKALFAGLHALPGQIDLFSVDGEPDQSSAGFGVMICDRRLPRAVVLRPRVGSVPSP